MMYIDYKRTYAALRQTFPDMPAKFELNLRSVYEKLITSGDVVIDCGAHTGKHTIPMAGAVGPYGTVYAFEANKYKVDALRTNLDASGHSSRVKIFLAAVGDEPKESVLFFVLPTNPGKSSLILREGLSPTEKKEQITVSMVRLDDCVAPSNVSFIKTDVEGAELMALRGAAGIIGASRPYIHFECGGVAYRPFGCSSVDFYRFFDSNDYLLFDIIGNRIQDEQDWLASDAASGLYDYIAAPKESEKLDIIVSELKKNSICPIYRD